MIMDQNFFNLPSHQGLSCSPDIPPVFPDVHVSINHAEIAHSLLLRGQTHLLKGELALGLELFDSAAKLAPKDAKLFYSQGLSLLEYGTEEGREKTLLLAGKKFKIATSLHPSYFEAWQAWGSALCTLGLTFQEHHYFLEAAKKLKKGLALSEGQPEDVLSDLNWELAVAISHLADHSGEAIDLHRAIENFQTAASYPTTLPADFWKDFGAVCLKFANQIRDILFYVKAISCFNQAIALDPASGWGFLAEGMQKLYALTHDEDHFTQANECYATATQLHPNDANLWFLWAQAINDACRRNPDTKRLRACIEKCQRAHAIDPEQPLILAIWSESLAALGGLTERIDLLFDAHNKIADVVERCAELPEVWFSLGTCLMAIGQYFKDEDFYYQAIEKFQSGISIDRTCHAHWHAIASAYARLGKLESDPDQLEQSLHFYQRAIDLCTSSTYIVDYAIALFQLGEMLHDQKYLDEAILQFEKALGLQKNAIYLHPDWLFHYACALDALGDFHEEDFYYLRAIEILSHVLMVDPDFYIVHHQLALALSHLGELKEEVDYFYRAIHHYRLSFKHDEENDTIILDWGISLINLAQYTHDPAEADQCYRDAEHKLMAAAKLGNLQSYYHLSALYSLMGNYDLSIAYLEKADQAQALPPIDEILQDQWLDGLRCTGDFREFLSHLEHRTHFQEDQ